MVPEAAAEPYLAHPYLRPDAYHPEQNAGGAWDDARPDAMADDHPSEARLQIPGDADAGKLAGPEPDDPERDAAHRWRLAAARSAVADAPVPCKRDAVPSAAQSGAAAVLAAQPASTELSAQSEARQRPLVLRALRAARDSLVQRARFLLPAEPELAG